ncbi:class I SAM-dependent methyltransferase [Aliiroseovarius sp.]|uniref:class I SAM-dependent methyltransferase n=1 Tax=Aliiroseovarius sp. TaxID=1872442 RepID=UPI003BACA8E7
MSSPEMILETYESVAEGFARARNRSLFERKWLDRLLNHAPARLPARRVLDLGCGPGLPIAAYLSDRGCAVTGVDGAASMVALFRRNLPRATGVEDDMRGLDLGEKFEVVLAWNSFFHLSADDQRGMFATFAAHAAPRAVLMFTSGPSAGEAIGEVEGQPVYHASLAPEEYRKLLVDNGFAPISFTPEDPECHGHSIWLARYMG